MRRQILLLEIQLATELLHDHCDRNFGSRVEHHHTDIERQLTKRSGEASLNLREDASRKRVIGGFDKYLSSGSENEKAAASFRRLGRSCPGVSTSRYMAAAELSSSMPAGSARILACAAVTVFHSYLLTITEE